MHHSCQARANYTTSTLLFHTLAIGWVGSATGMLLGCYGDRYVFERKSPTWVGEAILGKKYVGIELLAAHVVG